MKNTPGRTNQNEVRVRIFRIFAKKMIYKSLVLALLIFINCGMPKGEFGWATTDDSGIDILEKQLYVVNEYKMVRTNMIFTPRDTIHYIYMFDKKFYDFVPTSSTEFIVSLEKETLGFVEIEYKKKLIETDTYSLKDRFVRLEPGKYRIRVAFDGDVIDDTTFDVLDEKGFMPDDRYEESDEPDEIIKYSR